MTVYSTVFGHIVEPSFVRVHMITEALHVDAALK